MWCKLPAKGMRVDSVALRDTSDVVVWGSRLLRYASCAISYASLTCHMHSHSCLGSLAQEVARLPEGRERGVGVCSGPVISTVPTSADWIEYYTGKPMPSWLRTSWHNTCMLASMLHGK